jgi:hypothetical protein
MTAAVNPWVGIAGKWRVAISLYVVDLRITLCPALNRRQSKANRYPRPGDSGAIRLDGRCASGFLPQPIPNKVNEHYEIRFREKFRRYGACITR